MGSMGTFTTVLGGLPLAREGSFWFPPQASNFAAGLDFTYDLILWICVVFFVAILGATAWFVYKYRRRPGHKEERTSTHNTPLEIAWSVFPLILLMLIFGVSTYWYMQMITLPKNEKVYDISVRGQKWVWTFKYEGDPFTKVEVTPRLHVIKDQAYRLVMDSPDVIHSMYIPAFRVKQDCVPGRYNKLWFRPTMVSPPEGFDIYCTEYCGDDHSRMITKVIVHETADAWRDAIIKDADVTQFKPLVRGQLLFGIYCSSCHTLNGDPKIGPSFLGLWGKTEQFEDGTTEVVGREYVRQSITDPAAKIVKGYKGVNMTPFKDFTSDHFDGIFELLREHQPDNELKKKGDDAK